MKRLSHPPKVMISALAIALGFAVLGAGCSAGNDNNTPATAPNTPNAGPAGMAQGTGDSNQPVTDTWITTKVKATLATTQGVDDSGIDVETNNGVVTLSGTAPSQSAVDAMVAATQGIQGVTSVDTSNLQIGNATDNGSNAGGMSEGVADSQHPVQDTWITTKVKAKLHTVDGLDNSDLGVETNNGVVSLSGQVGSQSQVDAAVKATRTIEGVKDVDTSQLTVGPGASP